MSILREIVGTEDVDRAQRIARAKEDFEFFCRHYLPEAFPIAFGQYQKLILKLLTKGSADRRLLSGLKRFIKREHHKYLRPLKRIEGLLDIEPRDHGKTTRMSQALPLWLALTRQRVFVVVVGASKEKACDFLEFIKTELENNERLIEDFGYQRGSVWKTNKLVLKNGNCIAALGAGEAMRGLKHRSLRPTHIICDDLLKDQEVESRTSRQRLYRWFKKVVMNLGKDALVVVVNTIMHPDDLPSRLLQEIEEGTLSGWLGLRFSAIRPDGRPLWPERWSLEEIEKKRVQLGPHVFATEWENEPLPEEERKFLREWFQIYRPEELRGQVLRKVMAVDPATGKHSGDYSAVVVVGRAESGQLYVLLAWADRVSDMKLIRKIIEFYRVYRPERVIFETTAFQEVYKNQLLREAGREGYILPVRGVKHSINKELRISKLSPLVEAGIIEFRKDQRLLMQQLEEFPRGHDDLPDALEMAVSALVQDRRPVPQVFPAGLHRATRSLFRGYGKVAYK